MIWDLIGSFKKVKKGNKVLDDDFSDRLNHRYTVYVLIIVTIIIGSNQYVGKPILCWTPAHFTGAMVEYTHSICWISTKFYVRSDTYLQNSVKHEINYYQWVPFILMFMALGYFLPFRIWESLSSSHSLDPKFIMEVVQSSGANSGNFDATSSAQIIDRALSYYRKMRSRSFLGRLRRRLGRLCLPNHQSGIYLAAGFFSMKILYIINFAVQFSLLNFFMGTSFYAFGISVLQNMWHGIDFWESEYFPRVIMCNFDVRTLGENTHRQSTECTLPINLYNEKFFIFIWFWMCLTGLFSIYSLLTWMFAFRGSARFKFIREHLKISSDDENKITMTPIRNLRTSLTNSRNEIGFDAITLNAFVNDYLKIDGVLMLKIIKKNTNDIVVTDLVSQLWQSYAQRLISAGRGQPGPLSRVNSTDDDVEKNPESSTPKQNSFS